MKKRTFIPCLSVILTIVLIVTIFLYRLPITIFAIRLFKLDEKVVVVNKTDSLKIEVLEFRSGILRSNSHMVNYIKQGKQTSYFENGKIEMQGTMVKGKWSGKRIFYDQDGQKESVENYLEGVRYGSWYYYKNGNIDLTRVLLFKSGLN